MIKSRIEILNFSILPYLEAESLQRRLALERGEGRRPDTLLLLEHPPVYTIGRREAEGDLLIPENLLREKGIPLVKTDRGGRITFHGPGQLVGYFIFGLGTKTISRFVWEIEELLIRVLEPYDLHADRDPEYPGVWIKSKATRPEGPLRGRLDPALPVEGATQAPKKIAALGLHFEKGISRHGFSLNVACDLTPYQWIRPCGIPDRGVTSLALELKRPVSVAEVKERVAEQLGSLYETTLVSSV